MIITVAVKMTRTVIFVILRIQDDNHDNDKTYMSINTRIHIRTQVFFETDTSGRRRRRHSRTSSSNNHYKNIDMKDNTHKTESDEHSNFHNNNNNKIVIIIGITIKWA